MTSPITLITHPDQPPIAVLRPAENNPELWNLTWLRPPQSARQVRYILQQAENKVLPRGGEVIRFPIPPELPETIEQQWSNDRPVPGQEGYREIPLIRPDDDGLIHDDDDDRTPLRRINCPTCVSRIAESRARKYREATGSGPRTMAWHSQRTADAYARLSRIELAMTQRPARKQPKYPEPGPELRQRFNTLAARWEPETRSDPGTSHEHPDYREIIGLGTGAVPPILERLEKQGGYWFNALAEITGENPSGEKEYGSAAQMRLRWLDWGWQQGLLPADTEPEPRKTENNEE